MRLLPCRTTALAAAAALLLAPALLTAAPAFADVPFPQPATPPTDYTQLHIGNGSCASLPSGQPRPAGSDLPSSFDCRDTTKLTDYAAQPGDSDYDLAVATNPQELFGVKGPGTNRAWETTTGRPDTVIAIMDSGVIWDSPELVAKVALNRGELPPPCHTTPCNNHRGVAGATYDTDGNGVFNIRDYTGDPRVPDYEGRGYLTPEDLIRAFSDGVDHDGNGYRNDIAGWDFYQHDNDAADDVTYGHGTGEARDSSAEVTAKTLSQCPNCLFMPLRVGDSFVAEIDRFAAAVVYAVDNGASIVQEALGTVNHTDFSQRAVDYAYSHGVLVVASEADESAGHHNYPAALNHTMVVNSVTHFVDGAQQPKTYLAFNGCTNFGGYTWTSIESNSCSSDATGQSAGMAGLLYSAARNQVDKGLLAPDASGRPLSSEEAKQLVRLAADDVDFSTPKPPGPANNFGTTLPDSARFVTTAGWDQITGWGRLSSSKLVDLVTSRQIPPEADITSPRWWQPLGVTGSIDVVGRVAAPRAASYTYEVRVAPGVQPPPYPASDTWTTVTGGSGTAPKQGVLGTVDLAAVRAMIDSAPPAYTPANDPTSRDLPEKDAFRVRVVVHPAGGAPDAIEQRQYFARADPQLLPGFPRFLDADGASSPAFADVTGDGKQELLIADGNGFVHAFRADGSEAPGFPVHTDPLDWLPTTGRNGFTDGSLSRDVFAPVLLGSPLVVDLDHTGYPSVAISDAEGRLHVWDHLGHPRPGFPVTSNPAFSHDPGCETAIGPDCDHFTAHPVRNHVNTVDKAFYSQASAGDIDPSAPGPELVQGAMDGHVYAWHADGSPVAGWPVLPRDPAKIASVDPVSHRVSFVEGANAAYGRQVLTTPTIADIKGAGTPQVLVNVDEEYVETPNYGLRDPLLPALSAVAASGNTRIYAIWPDGTRHPGTERVAGLGDNAYVPGWPAKIGMVETELLPDVGSGSDGSPVVADLDGDGKPEVMTASIASPPYALTADGTSFYGNDPNGHYLTMASGADEFKNAGATDAPSIGSLGGGAAGRLDPTTGRLSFAMGATGLRRLLDIILPEQQLAAEDHLGAWDAQTGTYQVGFPAQMNDLMFFNTPAVADVDGSGAQAVLQSSAMYDVRGYRLGGLAAGAFPKFTGDWSVATPAVGDFLGGGSRVVAEVARGGELFAWSTASSACAAADWPKNQHDLRNTGAFATDAAPPGVLRSASLDGSTVHLVASGDNGYCGAAAHYVVTVDGQQHVLSAMPAAAGAAQDLDVSGLVDGGGHAVLVSAEDAAGNLSFPVTVSDGPPSTVPEAPLALLLPLAAVGVGAGLLARRRRAA